MGAFILSNSKRFSNNFTKEFIGFYTNNVYYTDTDSLYIEKKDLDVLDKAKLIGEELCRSKKDYISESGVYGLHLAPKTIYVLTLDEYGVIKEQKTFRGFNDAKRVLDRFQYFKLIEGEKISALLPQSWKKSFDSEMIVPTKMRFCKECNEKRFCKKCKN